MIIRESLETPVTASCDVLVCGGGIAGISAALAAARQGKSVALLEKQFILGGLGTAGLVTIYLPLCDGCGRQVSFGIAEELLRLSISMGAERLYPDNWLRSADAAHRTETDPRFEVQYNPALFALAAEQLLTQHGVTLLYGTYAVGVCQPRDRIEAVIVENKSGRTAIATRTVVDATGDADIAHFSTAPTAAFRQGNEPAAWHYSLGRDGYTLHTDGGGTPTEQQHYRSLCGTNGEDLSEMMRISHAATLRSILRRRESDPTLIPTAIATTPQVRMTRRLVGEYTLHDTEMHTRFSDAVGMVSDWRKRGPIYEVPFSTLYSRAVKNLVVAGRCTSVTDDMWDIMRVIPCCAVTGQAAGTAAALTDDLSRLDIRVLQHALTESGVILHEQDLPHR